MKTKLLSLAWWKWFWFGPDPYDDENEIDICERVVEILSIDERDLKNLLRHAYLIGYNEGRPGKDIDDLVDSREEVITELIEDFKVEGHCGYNEYPCSCSETNGV